MRYDDRTAEGRLWYVDDSDAEDNDDVCGELDGEADLLRQFDRGEKLYNYLDKRIWKQNEAKRAASIIMFN